MKIYFSIKIKFPTGDALGKYYFSLSNKSTYLPHHHALNVYCTRKI